jgi:hypothetical protein
MELPEAGVATEELPGAVNIAALDLDQLSEITTRAVNKVRETGADADLDRSEQSALEAIVALVGRPPLFIQNGRLQSTLEADWQHLDAKRAGRARGRAWAVLAGGLGDSWLCLSAARRGR